MDKTQLMTNSLGQPAAFIYVPGTLLRWNTNWKRDGSMNPMMSLRETPNIAVAGKWGPRIESMYGPY